MRHFSLAMALCSVVYFSSMVHAQTQIEVKVETVSNLGIAPVIAGFSDGSWDIFDVGSAASPALEQIAETGSPGGFSPPEGGPVFGNNPDPPIFTPGGMGSSVFTVSDGHTTFNMAAMLLPSNDWFVGTDSGFDISSLLNAAQGTSLSFDLQTVYDAGTELEDFSSSAGNGIIGVTNPGDGGPNVGTDQNGVVSEVTTADPFGTFSNLQPANLDTTQFDFAGKSIARVTLTTVPEPDFSRLAAAAMIGVGLLRRRRLRSVAHHGMRVGPK